MQMNVDPIRSKEPTRRRKPFRTGVVALLLCLAMLLPSSALADDDVVFEVIRISGASRYATALEVSKAAFGQSRYVVVANGENFPDALAGGPLASALSAPILLTAKDIIPAGILQEIVDLKASHVILLGGTGAISPSVESQLRAVATVERLGGLNRYETASLVAERVHQITGSNTVAITSGLNFPDALSASGYMGKQGMPILLTDPYELPDATRSYLEYNNTRNTIVLGGTGTVSEAVADQLPNPTRIAGSNRFGTSIALAEAAFEKPETVILVNGYQFPDALSSAAISGIFESPILLTSSNELPSDIADYLKEVMPKRVILVGGKGSITPDVAAKIIDTVGQTVKPTPTIEFEPSRFYDEYARQMMDSINTVREEHNLYPYIWDDSLAEAARTRAKEIVKNLSHTRPDGTEWNTVSSLAKGENLINLNALPKDVIQIQMSSSGYSGNILRDRSDFKAMGIACWTDERGQAFWVQLFGMPEQIETNAE
ncbi:MAG: cell wall-binding repeat-containing protein [Tissierellia bacterium]|nr:cell wall-binding repeat-containing protein [Tissierellia bacterium]